MTALPSHANHRYFGHIVSALVRRDGRLLLVEQQGPDDAEPAWALSGGKVEPGEDLVVALGRELREETGLILDGVPCLAFVVQVFRDMGAEVVEEFVAFTFACEVSGDIGPDDPDGLVLAAAWVEEAEALNRLALLDWYDSIPLRRWLDGSATAGAVYTVRSAPAISSPGRARLCPRRSPRATNPPASAPAR